VYQLASPASPPDYQRMPVQTLRANVVGTLNALDFAQAHGARVLLASTSEVYGDPQVHPQPEGYWGHVNPIGPRSRYDEGKRRAEALMVAHARQHGTAVRVARLFNTYGPRLRPSDGRVVSSFIAHALRGEPLPLHGGGAQTRSFCHVSDTVRGLLALMEHGQDLGPINLGNPHEVSMAELAREVLRLTGSSAGVRDAGTRGRPALPPARHHAGAAVARLAAHGQPAGRPGRHHRVVSHAGLRGLKAPGPGPSPVLCVGWVVPGRHFLGREAGLPACRWVERAFSRGAWWVAVSCA
jgi:nucleoside-diphosphate-sugar epimerase